MAPFLKGADGVVDTWREIQPPRPLPLRWLRDISLGRNHPSFSRRGMRPYSNSVPPLHIPIHSHSPRLPISHYSLTFQLIHTPLHPEHPKARLNLRRIHRGGYSQRQHHARVHRINDPVIPESRCAVVRAALVRVLFERGSHELLLFLRCHCFSFGLKLL